MEEGGERTYLFDILADSFGRFESGWNGYGG